jgi:hypothetical protein
MQISRKCTRAARQGLTYAGLVLTLYDAGPDGQYLDAVVMQQKGLYVKYWKYENRGQKHKIRVSA